jgi:threonine/homoserine/homoserine lactone efflux protein
MIMTNSIQNLLLGILLLTVAYLFYLAHKSWLNKINENDPNRPKALKKMQILKNWVFIIMFILCSIICFFKACFDI